VKIEIKSRWDSTILFTAEAASLLLALQAAIKSGADLYGADLYGANLYGADLSGANLYGANLSRADLSGATLYGANLSKADLYGANLSGANLYGATLSGADLSRANLSRADLYGADLSRANLYGATLYGANLSGADLSGATLYEANLSGANLSGADLSRANLYGADLSRVNNIGEAKNAELAQAQTSILPEGNLVGWKKCRGGVIVKLLIPQKARRSNATGRKCRAEYAKVLRIFGSEFAVSTHDPAFVYRKGAIVKPSNGWDENRFVECGSGIHFYLTRGEAEAN
jgi:uncharacterized protein YjbI with pentapeptide repeats